MKKQCKPWLFLVIQILTVFNLLGYCALRSMWFGIVQFTTASMPYILLAVIALSALITTIFVMNRKYPVLIASTAVTINLFFFTLAGVIIHFTLYATGYFIREFLYGTLFLGIIFTLSLLIPMFHKCSVFQKHWISSMLLPILLILSIFPKYIPALMNRITNPPVVYAVDHTYQIVFTSFAKGSGWVTIDGVEYHDTSAGSQRLESTVHKITVPMAALDNAGTYTISTKSKILHEANLALHGKTISKTYTWKGVRPEDGLNYYVISDTHNTQKTPYEAATYFGNDLDFLICCGDASSWIDRESDLTQVLRLTGKITNGEVPVIYARGNHETRGSNAQKLYRYVGASEENFYYTFRIKNIWGIVLDIGEDHGDQFEKYYGTAKFNAYRRAQTSFLDDVLENAEREFDAPGVDYRIAVCHIPLTIKYVNDHAGTYKDAWIQRLNKMKLTILFDGHVHQLWFIDDRFDAGSTLTLSPHYSGTETDNPSRIMTNAKFPAILVSRRSDGQLLSYPEKVFDTDFIGLAVTSDGETTTMKYTNEDHEVLENIVSPWFKNLKYGNQIVVENKH